MKKIIGISFSLLLLVSGCGGSGSGGGDLTQTSTLSVSRVNQDMVCCLTWDEENNTCTQYAIPETKIVSITVSKPSLYYTEVKPELIEEHEVTEEDEFTEEGDILFEGCTVEVIPNPFMPSEARDPKLIEEIKSYISCSGSDIYYDPNDEEVVPGTVEITYSQALLETLRPIWANYGKPLTYTIIATVKYSMSDREFKKVIKVPVDFGDFIEHPNDMCFAD